MERPLELSSPLEFLSGDGFLLREDQRIIRYGIIGTGRIARDFAADLRHVDGAALHSVCSREMETAKRFVSDYHGAACYSSLEAFLADPALDVVYIATPNSAHLPQALASIRAGKPAIIEKPLAMSAAAAQIISNEAAKQGVPVMEGMWIRFLPGIMQVKEMIDRGEIGKITAVCGDLSYAHLFDAQSRLFSKALGGGAALDLGVYLLSLSLYLFGSPSRVTGSWRAGPSGIDTSSIFTLGYAGFEANLSTSLDKTGGNTFEIAGTKGILRVEDPFIRGQRIRTLRGLAERSQLVRPSVREPNGLVQKLAKNLPLPGQRNIRFAYVGNGLQFEASAFADLIRRRDTASKISPLQDSIAVLQMIESVLSQPPV